MSVVAHVEARDIPNLFGNPDYYLGFDDEQVRELLAQADSGDADSYVSTMKKVVNRIMDQAGADTLFNLPNIVVTQPDVSGVPTNLVADGLVVSNISRSED